MGLNIHMDGCIFLFEITRQWLKARAASFSSLYGPRKDY